jgi:hypothetical protein
MYKYNKNLIIGLAISIVLHGLIWIRSSVPFVPYSEQEIEIQIPTSTANQPNSRDRSKQTYISSTIQSDMAHQISGEPVLSQQPLIADDAPHQPLTHDEWFIHSSDFKLKKWSVDNHQDNHQSAPFNTHEEDSRVPRRIMPMSSPQYEKKKEEFSLFPKIHPKSPELDFVPSDVELDALCSVWQQDSITAQQIYTRLDTSYRVTIEDVNNALEHLTDKGLLTRRIVSPQNKFKFFFLPEDRFGLELSPQNRRNRVYEYSSNLDQRVMLDFLNARAYQIEHSQESATSAGQGAAEKIKEKILHLLKK